MNLSGKTKIFVLTSHCDLSPVDAGIEGRLADKGRVLRSMRELLDTVVKSYCREQQLKPSDLDYLLLDRVQEGDIGVSLYVSDEYLKQIDLHDQLDPLQEELVNLLSKSVDFHNYRLHRWIHANCNNSSSQDGDETVERAVVDCAIRFSRIASDLPECLTFSQADGSGDDKTAANFSLKSIEEPIRTLPYSVKGEIICVLTGYNYDSRIIDINTGKRCYEITCNLDKLDGIRHLVDGRTWREILVEGKSSRQDCDVLGADNLSYISVVTERLYAGDLGTTILPN